MARQVKKTVKKKPATRAKNRKSATKKPRSSKKTKPATRKKAVSQKRPKRHPAVKRPTRRGRLLVTEGIIKILVKRGNSAAF